MGKRSVSVRETRTAKAGQQPDHHQPEARWTFDADVAACYDDMLARSIPQIAAMRAAVTALAKRFAVPGTAIVDLGCSLGGAMAPLVADLGADQRFMGIDNSAPMLAIARDRFADTIDAGIVRFVDLDLRTDYPEVQASVTLAILTLQFIPIERRQQLLQHIYAHTRPGGAVIVVDKILGATADLNDQMVAIYEGLKADGGYTPEQIARKRVALEGVQVPVTASMNEQMLRDAGFREIDGFWRWMNFAGWLAIRPAQLVPQTRAIRGAITVAENTPEAIHSAARDLMLAIVNRNALDPDELVSAFFTLTTDLNAAFPAKAVRQLGWQHVALLCGHEIPVPGALQRCLRVLVQIHTARPRDQIRSVYLRGTEQLLQDDCEPAG